MKKALFLLALITLAFSITSCGEGISGSVTGSRQRCSSDFGGGACEGSFKKLSGTYSENISMVRTGLYAVRAEV